MKPLIRKGDQGKYWCSVREEHTPSDDADAQDWYSYSSCGCGDTINGAYQDWVEDCIMPDEDSVDWNEFKVWMESGNVS